MITVTRYSYSPTETEGFIMLPDGSRLATIEQPWNNNKPFSSCIPEGIYDLVYHNGNKYKNTYALVNPSLHVYHLPEDRGSDTTGRYACVFHSANWASQLLGCIAPGLRRHPMVNRESNQLEQAVASSRLAMEKLLSAIRNEGISKVQITSDHDAGLL
jgi:hypothetical protein